MSKQLLPKVVSSYLRFMLRGPLQIKKKVHSTDNEHVEYTKQRAYTFTKESLGTQLVRATVPIKRYKPSIPFSQTLQKHKLEKQYTKFIKVFKKLHISIYFAVSLIQMPSYAKFLKDILSNKCKLDEHETVMLTNECIARRQNKLPLKLKDTWSFTVPCTISKYYFDKALCDLGASINLMLLSIFRKLCLRKLK